jgi:hypothetical protein
MMSEREDYFRFTLETLPRFENPVSAKEFIDKRTLQLKARGWSIREIEAFFVTFVFKGCSRIEGRAICEEVTDVYLGAPY